jgi:hypothetical protein
MRDNGLSPSIVSNELVCARIFIHELKAIPVSSCCRELRLNDFTNCSSTVYHLSQCLDAYVIEVGTTSGNGHEYQQHNFGLQHEHLHFSKRESFIMRNCFGIWLVWIDLERF